MRVRAGPRPTVTSKALGCRVMDAQLLPQVDLWVKRQLERYIDVRVNAPKPYSQQPGMRSCRRSCEGKEDVRTSCTASWRTWNGQNRTRACCEPRVGDKGAILSHSGQRDLLCRGQEDGGAHGELQESDRYVSSSFAPLSDATL
jgi:hypothetical protein